MSSTESPSKSNYSEQPGFIVSCDQEELAGLHRNYLRLRTAFGFQKLLVRYLWQHSLISLGAFGVALTYKEETSPSLMKGFVLAFLLLAVVNLFRASCVLYSYSKRSTGNLTSTHNSQVNV